MSCKECKPYATELSPAPQGASAGAQLASAKERGLSASRPEHGEDDDEEMVEGPGFDLSIQDETETLDTENSEELVDPSALLLAEAPVPDAEPDESDETGPPRYDFKLVEEQLPELDDELPNADAVPIQLDTAVLDDIGDDAEGIEAEPAFRPDLPELAEDDPEQDTALESEPMLERLELPTLEDEDQDEPADDFEPPLLQ